MTTLPDPSPRSSTIRGALATTIAYAIKTNQRPGFGQLRGSTVDDWIPVTDAAWQRVRRLVRRVRCDAAGRAGRVRHSARARTRRARRTSAARASSSDSDGPSHAIAVALGTERAA